MDTKMGIHPECTVRTQSATVQIPSTTVPTASIGPLAQRTYSNSVCAHGDSVGTWGDVNTTRAQSELGAASAFDFQARPQVSSMEGSMLFIGLEAICNAVGAGPRTVKKWMAEDGFPARRYSDGVYRASVRSVERWFEQM
ncbi:MAG: hypothetical protein R3Y11_02295 [Pseudomonadota bacterium]